MLIAWGRRFIKSKIIQLTQIVKTNSQPILWRVVLMIKETVEPKVESKSELNNHLTKLAIRTRKGSSSLSAISRCCRRLTLKGLIIRLSIKMRTTLTDTPQPPRIFRRRILIRGILLWRITTQTRHHNWTKRKWPFSINLTRSWSLICNPRHS